MCVFAYGQTGTGKTFTMDGTNEKPRIVPRALEEFFRQASLDNTSSFTFTMSMLELHISSLTRINIFRHGDALEAKSEVSKLWMIDLEGSKQLLKTGAKELTLDEGRAINLSLLALGDVVAALKRKRCHVPFRNS
ncbi:hypothetical protein JHK82_015853 [Glycine max]|nr:hypothetical protein JHK82_015853 [Glycine max]